MSYLLNNKKSVEPVGSTLGGLIERFLTYLPVEATGSARPVIIVPVVMDIIPVCIKKVIISQSSNMKKSVTCFPLSVNKGRLVISTNTHVLTVTRKRSGSPNNSRV